MAAKIIMTSDGFAFWTDYECHYVQSLRSIGSIKTRIDDRIIPGVI